MEEEVRQQVTAARRGSTALRASSLKRAATAQPAERQRAAKAQPAEQPKRPAKAQPPKRPSAAQPGTTHSDSKHLSNLENVPNPNILPPSQAITKPSKRARSSQPETTVQPATLHHEKSSSTKPILNIDNDPNRHPDILPRHTIDTMRYSKENKRLIRKHLIALGITVEKLAYPRGRHKDHVSILSMIQTDKFWNFFCYLWELTDRGALDKEKIKVIGKGLKYLKKLFRNTLGIELDAFREDLEELYEKKTWSEFTKTMYLYTIRLEQYWCVVEGCDYDTTMYSLFGGAGYNDSDHALENLFRVFGILKKSFGLDVNCTHLSWPRIFHESILTFRTCCCHHQHDSSTDTPFALLANVCSNVYTLMDTNDREIGIAECLPVAPCLVQESDQMSAVHSLTEYYKDMSSKDLLQVTYEEVAESYNAVSPIAFEDAHRQTPEKWDSSTAAQRKTALRRTEMTIEKSCCRKCFLCDKDALNVAAKFMSGFHLHHMLELMKRHDPSAGVSKTLDGQRFENRKTICLCAGCHMQVTHVEAAKQRLAEKFERLGYYVVIANTVPLISMDWCECHRWLTQ